MLCALSLPLLFCFWHIFLEDSSVFLLLLLLKKNNNNNNKNQTCCLCPHTPHLTFFIIHILIPYFLAHYLWKGRRKTDRLFVSIHLSFHCFYYIHSTFIFLADYLNPLHLDKTTCLLSALCLCMESTVKVSDQI